MRFTQEVKVIELKRGISIFKTFERKGYVLFLTVNKI